MKKILISFGTRPEIIKMWPIFLELKKSTFDVRVCHTGQHRDMADQLLRLFDWKPDYDLNLMHQSNGLNEFLSNLLHKFVFVLNDFKPDLVLVHGDTTSAMGAAICCFNEKIKVGHVEAGLRTSTIENPWPEEGNRRLISILADLHFAPTLLNLRNLEQFGVNASKVHVSGNSVIDALLLTRDLVKSNVINIDSNVMPFLQSGKPYILITCHRRENFGNSLRSIFEAILEIAERKPNFNIIFPVHKNPKVRLVADEYLSNIENIFLSEPLDYASFIALMDSSHLILTDSGGIQEEAPSLNVPLLVLRKETERPEALETEAIKLIGNIKRDVVNETIKLLENPIEYGAMAGSANPFGDGKAAYRIVLAITNYLKG